MGVLNFRLRTKSILALVVACLVALAPMILIGMHMLELGKAHFGRAYAENFTLLKAQEIKEPVSRELALAQRFADSVLLQQWLQDEDSQRKRSLFFQEAAGYQEAFQDSNYFLVNRSTLAYYFNGPDKEYSRKPRYYLDTDNPDDSWFFSTLEDFDTYTINVNPDVHLGKVQVWINTMIWNNDQKIGMAGTGLELSAFLKKFINADEPGLTPIILDAQGLIQAHPDKSLIAYGSGAKTDNQNSTRAQSSLQNQLSCSSGAQKLTLAMQESQENPESVETFWADLNGDRQLLALTWIPELKWHVITAVNLKAAQVLEGTWIGMAIAAFAGMFAVLLLVFGYGVDRIVLRPLNDLHQSATALARGKYDVSLPTVGADEVGDLTRAFAGMVEEIKSHTRELEDKVRDRTSELEEKSTLLEEAKEKAEKATQVKTESLDKVMESIHYAQTIQQAIMSTEDQLKGLIPESFCLWQPKDVISGDIIWSSQHQDGFALAVLDCTGHGVPGGVMTMAAVSALNRVVNDIGVNDPARILQEVSRIVQKMLSSQDPSNFSEDGLDMGVCVYFRSRQILSFAGSRMSLFQLSHGKITETKGDRQSLGYRSADPDYPFQTSSISIQGRQCFYLSTDGVYDQVGHERSLPLGKKRLMSFLESIQGRSMEDQKQALQQMLARYQGKEEQRDDVTFVCFCLQS